MMRLIHAQSRLIDEGILLRGAVTVGQIVRSWGQLFGPGLIEAYEFDGVYFLAYLRAMNGEFDEPDYYLDFLLRHRDLIRRGLRRFPQVSTAREKYEWLSNYHNATVTKLFGKREEKYLV
jgi:hypothetical protein